MNYKMNHTSTLDGMGKDIIRELNQVTELLADLYAFPKAYDSVNLEDAISQLEAIKNAISISIPYYINSKHF